MKTVLVIGGGIGQVPLIEYAHAHGYRAVVVSPQGPYPGLKLADAIVVEDIRYPDRILANELLKDETIAAVVTDQLDEAVPTVARLTAHFGVPGNPIDVAIRFKDKHVMRQAAEKLGIAVPKSVRVAVLEELPDAVSKLHYPMMIKPLDSASSRGVYKAHDLDELIRYFPDSRRYSLSGVIVEEFVKGREYVVEGFTQGGRTTNLIVGHRDYFDIPGTFIPCATVFRDACSATDTLEKRLKETNVHLVEGFGLMFGLTHAEYIYNEEEDILYLVEVAARGGGVCISSDLIPAACGVNSTDIYMRAALGESVGDLVLAKGAAAYFCFILPEGEVAAVEGVDDLVRIPGFLRAVLDNVKIGMKISKARDKYSRK